MMAVDITKLVISSNNAAFKNNNIYPGFFVISGSVTVGLNTRTAIIPLSAAPDLCGIKFNGPAAFGGVTDPRPADGWFSVGSVYVRGDNAGAGYTNYPTTWNLSANINGSTVTITAYCRVDFTATLTLTSTTVNYRLVDYSVF